MFTFQVIRLTSVVVYMKWFRSKWKRRGQEAAAPRPVSPALVWWPGGSPSLGSFLSLLQAAGTTGEGMGGRATITLRPSSELAMVVVEGLERGPQSPLCLEAIEMCCNPWWHLVLSCTRP